MLDTAKPIPRIDGLKAGQIPEEILSSETPVVLTGLVNEWPMVAAAEQGIKASADYLRRFYRGSVVDFFLAPPQAKGRFFYNQDLSGLNFSRGRAGLDEILAQLMTFAEQPDSPSLFVGSTSVDGAIPGFRQENDMGLDHHNPLVSIWLGNQSRIAAHYDLPSNLACVVAGQRRFTLFPPEQIGNLYVGPIDFTPAGQAISMVDFHQPDLSRYPKFEEAAQHALVAELSPGDGIIIPSMWWHHVEGLTDFNALVNYWWRSTPDYMGAPINVLFHSLLTLKGLPESQRKAWQGILEHYVFNDDPQAFDHIPDAAKGPLGDISAPMSEQMKTLLIEKIRMELKRG